ncbi:hypothetical protein [Apis mellifera associated microvirus 11]|nr:hypothetical protein [Apis mellifera associated microvirus 11]AZL82779.1 hypothetical protein [Apis mellifera associated microvirus 11]
MRPQNTSRSRGANLQRAINEERELRARVGAEEYDRAAAMAEDRNVKQCPCYACMIRARFRDTIAAKVWS